MKQKTKKMIPFLLIVGLILNTLLFLIIIRPINNDEDDVQMTLYNYKKTADIDDNKYPKNNHMVWEISSTKVYFVDSSNAKVLLKLNPTTGAITTVTTRSNKDIARAFHDRDNTIIYFVDCDFDDTISYIWSMNTSTEAINEITSIPADVFDIWIYDSDLYYYYFGSGGYSLETSTIDPDGDGGTLEWTSTDDPNHSTTVDEGATPNTADYISSETDEDQDILTFPNGLDLSGYDYHGIDPTDQIYEIVVKLYGKGGKIKVSGPAGLGMNTPQTITFDSVDYAWQQATFSGLSLEDSDLDDLQITLEHELYNGSYLSFTNQGDYDISDTNYPDGICWDGTYFYVVSYGDGKVYKYNSSFVLQTSYSISETIYPYGICWDGTYFYVVSYGDGKVYKYNSSFTYQTDYSISETNEPNGICWDGTYFYVVSSGDGKVYKYNSSFVLQTSYSISETNYPDGICWDGTYFYVVSYGDRKVYKYNSSFVLQTSYSISETIYPYGICWDGTYFYVVSFYDEKVYKYDDAGYCYVATVRVDMNFYGDELVELVIKNHTDNSTSSNDMGTIPGRQWDSSQIAIVGDQFWFLWKWSNENVELWKFDVGDDAFTEMEDCGATTEIPTFNQNGIAYDDSDVLSFVLGTGTAEVSTIVAQVPANIDDGDYITYSAISLDADNNRSETDYYIWFDKVGDESGDPAPVDKTKITVDISAAADAQDVSDAIQAAIDAVDLITAANGGGTSTTVTITNHYNGDVTNMVDVDSGLSVATTTPGVDDTFYYYTYAITSDTLTKKGVYNISLMLNRNTKSSNNPPFNLEKGFGLTVGTNALSIYQISRSGGNVYKIAQLDSTLALKDYFETSYIRAISDTFLIIHVDDDEPHEELWTFQDFNDHVLEYILTYTERDYPTAELTYDARHLGLEEGMFVQFIGPIRINGVTDSNGIQFEGYIITPEDENTEAVYIRTVDLVNPSYFDLRNAYNGALSEGGADNQLDEIDDSFKYITKGVYDEDSGTLLAYTKTSDKDNQLLIDQLAVWVSGTWRIRPTGELDFTAGDNDSGLDYDQDTPMDNVLVKNKKIRPNSITVNGAYIDGVRINSEAAYGQDLADQQEFGIISIEINISQVSTVALANSYADIILALINQSYIEIIFSIIDATNGFVLPTEELTIANSDKGITSAQFKINQVIFNGKTNETFYTVSSIVRWDEEDLQFGFDQELSDQVSQVAGSVETNISDISDNTSDISDSTSDISDLQTEIGLENYITWRTSEPTDWDLEGGDFTVDSAWHELSDDLDNWVTVPDGAIGMLAYVYCIDNSSGYILQAQFRSTTQSGGYQVSGSFYRIASTGVNDIRIGGTTFIPLDSNHRFDYKFGSNTEVVNFSVIAWVIGH